MWCRSSLPKCSNVKVPGISTRGPTIPLQRFSQGCAFWSESIHKFQVFDQKWHLMATVPLTPYIILFVCFGWSHWWPRFQSKFIALEAVTVFSDLTSLMEIQYIILVKGTSSLNYVELTDNLCWYSRMYGALNLHGVGSIHIHLEFLCCEAKEFRSEMFLFTHHYS